MNARVTVRRGDGLILPLDHAQWDRRSVAEIAADAGEADPVWIRIANFHRRPLEVLKHLPAGARVLWKLEFSGYAADCPLVPASRGIDPHEYIEEVLSLPHHVVPYTFLDWNRDELLRLYPALRKRPLHVIPIAQKRPVARIGRQAIRAMYGIPAGGFVYGAGGNELHPGKRVGEVVEGFLETCTDPNAHLLCTLVPRESATAAARWPAAAAAHPRVHVRVGEYHEWAWMTGFYRAVDVLLANSVSDSWGRMVAEAAGAGVPVVVRRARCGTNLLAPDLAITDSLRDFTSEGFVQAVKDAQAAAPALRAFFERNYRTEAVVQRLLAVTDGELPPELARRTRLLAEDRVDYERVAEVLTY
ncbi:hypothetical protein AB0I49_25620 [Streptomyces sp. NPDC050617]|uniref:glycosyltransferase n=1 Tax=Streptomyces sp. NPDC050617 TaxID=3154628 RepID=UPI0034207A31